MRHCYVGSVEMGGPDCVRSAIGYNEYGPNQGRPLPCNGNDTCTTGMAMAALLRGRLENGGHADSNAPDNCTASADRIDRSPPARNPDEYVQTFAHSE